jgi:hypothetical protein
MKPSGSSLPVTFVALGFGNLAAAVFWSNGNSAVFSTGKGGVVQVADAGGALHPKRVCRIVVVP